MRNWIRHAYLVGETGTCTFSFEEPPPNLEPSGWHYVIKPPIGEFEHPRNLVMQIT